MFLSFSDASSPEFINSSILDGITSIPVAFLTISATANPPNPAILPSWTIWPNVWFLTALAISVEAVWKSLFPVAL